MGYNTRRLTQPVVVYLPSWLPRNNLIWEVDPVMKLLKSWAPVSNLDLKRLSLKFVKMLLSLLAGQRGQTIHNIDIRNVDVNLNRVKIRFGDLLKTSRPGVHQEELNIKGYAPDRRLCVCMCMTEYLKRTEKLRGDRTELLLSFCKPNKPISRDTLARWIKEVLRLAGIDISMYSPHSVRAASVSAAREARVPLKTILSTAGWSSEGTFAKYYSKKVDKRGVFASAILNKK